MNDYIKRHQIRLLLVEDHEDERIECRDFLRRRFPKVQIDEAGSREEALELISRAHSLHSPYDCAILDLELPEKVGEGESADTSIATSILDLFGNTATRLIQWTAYPEDEAIQDFKSANKIPKSGIVYEIISKRETKWPDKMERFIGRLIAEKAVGRWLDEPYFMRMRQRSVAVISKRPDANRAPVSLPGFVHALVEVWPLLETHRKREALETFQGTDWEMAEEGGIAMLKNVRKARSLKEARENAQIFENVMTQHEGISRQKS